MQLYLGHQHCCSGPADVLGSSAPLHIGSTCLEVTITLIAVVIISLALCFLPIVVGVQILGENVVILPED
jgi:hypothetical protein